jgi:hypothetical protein
MSITIKPYESNFFKHPIEENGKIEWQKGEAVVIGQYYYIISLIN